MRVTSEARLKELAAMLANHPFLGMAVDELVGLEKENAELHEEVEREKRVKLEWYHELTGCRERELHLGREVAELRERLQESGGARLIPVEKPEVED